MSKKDYPKVALSSEHLESLVLPDKVDEDRREAETTHAHTFDTVTKWDHHSGKYSGILDYSEALEVLCSGCLERTSLEETV